MVPFEGCGFISEEETSLAEALCDSGESTVRVDAFSTAEADEGVAMPLMPTLTLPMVLASPPLGLVADERRWDRRRRLSKKDGFPAMTGGRGLAGETYDAIQCVSKSDSG
jgi:hypothetical protein